MGYSRYYAPPGLLSLAAVAEAEGHCVKVYDADYSSSGDSYSNEELYFNYDRYCEELKEQKSEVWAEIEQVICDFSPDYVGLSVLSSTIESAKLVAHIAKKIKPNVKIISGGPHASIAPNDLLGFSDYVVQYEGEYKIVGILAGHEATGILQGERIENLDELPLPAIHLLHNLEQYEKRDLSLVISSRGCPFACGFCCSPQLWERKVTRKSVKRFIEELRMLRDRYGVSDFYISDDSFTYDRKWLEEFCHDVGREKITWRCLTRVDLLDKKLIEMMKNAGCRNVKIGIESGSPRVLKLMGKNINLEDVYTADKLLSECNMPWSAFFMIGITGETAEDIILTQKLMKEITANSMTVSIFTPFPGTALEWGTKLNYSQYSHHSPHNNFTGTMTDKRFRELAIETFEIAKRNYSEHNNVT
jgi:radical SAM superfamily enzyme YgiQ (UPF0313 family)